MDYIIKGEHMKIWNQKIFDSNNLKESNFAVEGFHRKLGSGILTTHKSEWHAIYNKMLINSDGGGGRVISINKRS